MILLIENYSTVELIDFPQKGGGVFIKLLTYLNIKEVNAILSISFISLLVLDFLFKENRFQNYFLLITIIISLPLSTIYQKYLDPLFYLIFLDYLSLII